MVNSSKKCQDEWGVKGYGLADFNAHLDKPTIFSIAKETPGKPRDYISMIQKEKKLIPGPIYNVGLDIGKGGKFFIPKSNAPNYFGSVMNEAKKTPGVGKYDLASQKKQKVLGTYTQKATGGGFTDAALFKGMTTPSHYNAVDLNLIKNRTLATKIQKPKDAKPDNKLHKDNSPSPFHYRKEDSIDKTQRTNISYGVPKGPKQSFTDFEIKKTKIVPGIGKYDITKADRVLTLGARRGYK